MTNNYKSFTLFNDVTDKDLQAFNRLAMIYNIAKDHGNKDMADYAGQISEDDRKLISEMASRIRVEGYETVRKNILKSYNETLVIEA